MSNLFETFKILRIPSTELKEIRRGLFSLEWIFNDQMKELGTIKKTIELCGSQSGRAFNITCNHKHVNDLGYFTVTVEDVSCHSDSTTESSGSTINCQEQPPSLSKRLRAVRRLEFPSALPAQPKSTEHIPPVYIWMKHNGNPVNQDLFQKTSLARINTEKWEAMCRCQKNKPYKLLLWIDFGTNTATERYITSGFEKLFYDQNQCDVQFQFKNGQSVGAHVLILSAGSPVFAAMFQSGLVEAQTRKVYIVDIEMEVFRQLLICLYTGRAPKLTDKAMTPLLFQAADKYGVETLKNECLDELLEQLDVGNAIDMLIWSHFNYVPELFESAMEIFVENSSTICYQPEWMDLIEKYPDLCLLATQRIVGPPNSTPLEEAESLKVF